LFSNRLFLDRQNKKLRFSPAYLKRCTVAKVSD
jgi:hypothetical protein